MDEQDTQPFGSRSELFLRSVFELFVAGCSLSCSSFSCHWLSKFNGRKMKGRKMSGEYQMLLPTAVSKKHVLQCAQKMSAYPRKLRPLTNATFAEQKATIFVNPVLNW
jgi:hypothetical protein